MLLENSRVADELKHDNFLLVLLVTIWFMVCSYNQHWPLNLPNAANVQRSKNNSI